MCIYLHKSMKINEKIEKYLSSLGVETEEQHLFVLLCELGTQPASIIATRSGLERTKTYRLLDSLVEKWLIVSSQRSGVKVYFVADFSGIDEIIEKRKAEIQYLEAQKKNTLNLLQSISRTDMALPSVRIYEGDQLESLFTDMIATIRTSSLKTIRFFGSNTFEEQSTSRQMHDKFRHFLDVLSEQKVAIETFLGTWSLIMERIEKHINTPISELPLAESSTHLFVMGWVVYIIIYRDKPIGIKFESQHFSHVIHLLLDNVIVGKN